MGEGNINIISINETKDLIVETLAEFSVVLDKLESVAIGNSKETRRIIDVYRNYSELFGAQYGANIEERVYYELISELNVTKNKELNDIINECQKLARLYNLPVWKKMKGDLVVEENQIITVPKITNGGYEIKGDTIICNIKNKNVMQNVLFLFKLEELRIEGPRFNKVVATDNEYLFIIFESAKDLSDFVNSDVNYEMIVDAITAISQLGSIGGIALNEINPRISNSIRSIATGLSVILLVIDIRKAINDPNLDTISDVIIDGIGLVPHPYFTVVSVGLFCSKLITKGTIKFFKKAGEFIYFINKEFPSLFEIVNNFHTNGYGNEYK
jgi:hypothetical protein